MRCACACGCRHAVPEDIRVCRQCHRHHGHLKLTPSTYEDKGLTAGKDRRQLVESTNRNSNENS
jgi:hypothetical protein